MSKMRQTILQGKNKLLQLRKQITMYITIHSLMKFLLYLLIVGSSFFIIRKMTTIYTSIPLEKLSIGALFSEAVEEQPTNETNEINETSDLVNINTASKTELMTLTNIGAKKAEAIIEAREIAAFSSIEEITTVKGIGEKTFEQLSDYITV